MGIQGRDRSKIVWPRCNSSVYRASDLGDDYTIGDRIDRPTGIHHPAPLVYYAHSSMRIIE